MMENRDKIVLAPASSAYKHALKEVLSAPGISALIKNTKAAREVGQECTDDMRQFSWSCSCLLSYTCPL